MLTDDIKRHGAWGMGLVYCTKKVCNAYKNNRKLFFA